MKLRLSICLLTFGICHVTHAADWRPAGGPLLTRWATEVAPDNVWPEYPRPQMVRERWVNLNGLWDYAIQDKEGARPTQWDGQILVPFAAESALSGVMKAVQPTQRLWYRRMFERPGTRSGDRVLLHFGAVDWDSIIWVNGTQVGTHRGGYDPFTFDVTDQLKQGANEVVLSVWDPTNTGYQPRGKQVLKPGGIMYTAVTGIWQTVWLETVPSAHVESLKIVPDIDRSIISVVVRARLGGRVQLTAVDGDQVVATQSGVAGQAVEMKIRDAKLWSPDSPHLYDLQVDLFRDGKTVDSVASYFGMRKTHVARDTQGVNRLLLNNEVLFQYGPWTKVGGRTGFIRRLPMPPCSTTSS